MDIDMPEERVVILYPSLEDVSERITFEEMCLLVYRKSTHLRTVAARANYKFEMAN